MDVDASPSSPLHSLFLHWMSLPSTSVYIQHALHSIRFPSSPTPPHSASPLSPSTAHVSDDPMSDSHPPPTSPHPSSSFPLRNGTRPPSPPDSPTSSSKPPFIITLPSDAPDAEVVKDAPGSLLSPPPSLSPQAGSPSSSPPYRVALRVDTDTRFSQGGQGASPPLSPKSPAKQSPPSSQSPDPSQHSPHKKRKSNNATSQSPATSPTPSPPHRLSSTSPPKSPRAATPPRSPITRSPSSSSLLLPSQPPPTAGHIRQFWWPEGEPVSPGTRSRDERRIRRLFRRVERGEKEEEEKEEDADEAVDEDDEAPDAPQPALPREALYPITTRVCGLSSYVTGALYAALLAHSRLHFPHYHLHDHEAADAGKAHSEAEEKSAGAASQSEMDMKEALAASTTSSPLIHLDVFLSYYHAHIQPFDTVTRFFRVLRSTPSSRYLVRDNFKPIVADIVSRHPGLEFLQSTPEFQFKYAQTVIARIFYQVNVSGSERMTLTEVRQSNLLLMLGLLDQEDDINKLNDFFSYEHFYVIYCICQGTLVNLADGTSVPIEQVRVHDSVLSYATGTADQKEGLTPRQVQHVFDMGVKECVELLFSDGRTLTCTPDHRLRTADGRWVEAGALVIDVDEVAVGAEYPDSTFGANPTAEWRLDLQATLGYELNMAQKTRHSLAFARLLGYLLTDGTANDDYSVWYTGHQLDIDAVQRDMLLLTDVAPAVTAGTRTLQISAPRPLHRAFQHVGVEGGKRTSTVTRFPAFVTAADCPLPIVREFLGGLFGGDGCTLGLGPGGGMSRLTGLGFVTTRSGDVAEQQQALLQQELFALLQRCGVDTTTISTSFVLVAPNTCSKEGAAEYSELQSQSATLTPTVTAATLDPTQHYRLKFLIGAAGVTSFARRVGFRYSCHKQQRLSAAVACYRGRERYLEQKRQLSTRTVELCGTPPTRSIKDALQQAKAELSRDEQLLPRIKAWWPTEMDQLLAMSKARFDNDNVENQLQAMNSRRFFSAPHTQTRALHPAAPEDGEGLAQFCRAIAMLKLLHEGVERLPAEELAGRVEALVSCAVARQPDWLRELLRRRKGMRASPPLSGSESVDQVTYGVHEDARVLPLFRVRLIGRRAVGPKHVYDLSVPSEQGDHTASFTANGIVAHNCKFWELDSDHDGFIDINDLSSYDDYALTSKVVERVIAGCGRPLLSQVKGKMNYLDFVVFLVSEIDKAQGVSIDYWFNCIDLDGDGVITGYEMEAFFEEQKQRIQALSQEQITFIDILCQLADMVKGGQEAGKDLLPLSSAPVPSRSSASQLAMASAAHLQTLPAATFTKKDLRSSNLAAAFFNTLFNLNKFILSEQRDPVRIKQIHDTPQLSDWDRYAISGYYRLAEVDAEDGGVEEEVGEEEGDREDWRSRGGGGAGGEAGEVYVREDVEEDEEGDGMEVDEHGGTVAHAQATAAGDAMTDSVDDDGKR